MPRAASHTGWFVSETSVRVAPDVGARGSDWVTSQAAQIDPRLVPYFVIPSGFRAQPWDATPGDAGVVLDAGSNRSAFFVVGDTGGALDEASLALHIALRGGGLPPQTRKISALGELVTKFSGGTPGKFLIAIFRHTSTKHAATLTLTAKDLPQWIETTSQAKIATIGGLDRIRACAQ